MSETLDEQLLAAGDDEGAVEPLTADQQEALLADDGPDDTIDFHVGEGDRFHEEEEEDEYEQDRLSTFRRTSSEQTGARKRKLPSEQHVKRENDDEYEQDRLSTFRRTS